MIDLCSGFAYPHRLFGHKQLLLLNFAHSVNMTITDDIRTNDKYNSDTDLKHLRVALETN